MVNTCPAQERLLYWLKDSACDSAFQDIYVSEFPLWLYLFLSLITPQVLLGWCLLTYRSCTLLLLVRSCFPYLFRLVLFNNSLAGHWGHNASPGLNTALGYISTYIASCSILLDMQSQPSLSELQFSLYAYEIHVFCAFCFFELYVGLVTRGNADVPGSELVRDQILKSLANMLLWIGIFAGGKQLFVEKLIWLRSSFYWRNGGLWLVSFIAIYSYRPGFPVILYFLGKLALTIGMDLYLTRNEHIQVLSTATRIGIPLRPFELGFPAPAQSVIVNSVVGELTWKMKQGKKKRHSAWFAQQYTWWTDSITLLSEANRIHLTHSMAYFPSKPFFLRLFHSKKSLQEWKKLKQAIVEMMKEHKSLLLSNKLAVMKGFVELAENRAHFLWTSGKRMCNLARLPRGLHFLVACYF